MNCSKTVPEPLGLWIFGLASSEKQIPQIVVNVESKLEGIEPLDGNVVLPKQVLYQAEPRPDAKPEGIFQNLDHPETG